eukprot:gene12769-14691_t
MNGEEATETEGSGAQKRGLFQSGEQEGNKKRRRLTREEQRKRDETRKKAKNKWKEETGLSGRAWARSARGAVVIGGKNEDEFVVHETSDNSCREPTKDKICPVVTSDIIEGQMTNDISCLVETSDIVEQVVTSDSCDGELAAAGMCGARVVSKPLSEYQVKLQMYREEYKTFRQPCALNDGNCLMASLLACVGTDNERKVLLGFTIDDEVDWHSGEAYQHYRKFCRVSLKDESLGDKSKGVYQWLQHLQKTGKISQYVWKRNRFLEGDLSAWFHNKVQAWAGKDFIVFGYHGDSRKVTEEMERVYETWPSEQAKVGTQTPAVCWRKVAKEWM